MPAEGVETDICAAYCGEAEGFEAVVLWVYLAGERGERWGGRRGGRGERWGGEGGEEGGEEGG